MPNPPPMTSSRKKSWTAALVIIGDEILSGRNAGQGISRRSQAGCRCRASALPRCGWCRMWRAGSSPRSMICVPPTISVHHRRDTARLMSDIHRRCRLRAALGVPVVINPEARAAAGELLTPPRAGSTKVACAWPACPRGPKTDPQPHVGRPPGIRRGNLFLMQACRISPQACSMRSPDSSKAAHRC